MTTYTASQNKAIHHEGENILVSASAGSGKTGVLKARVLRKLNDGIDIDRLIVLTFTEAAAAEMKSRIIDELQKNRLDNQLIKLDNAIISTFDAFTLRLVREYHYLLNLPSDVQISDKLLIEMESRKVLDEVISSYYLNHSNDFKEMVKLLFSGNDSFLNKGILSLAKAIKKMPNFNHILNHYDSIYHKDMLEKAYQEYFEFIHQDLVFIYQKYMTYYNENYRAYDEACDIYLNQCKTIYQALADELDIKELIQLISDFKIPSKPRKPRNTDEWLETNDKVKKQVKNIQIELESTYILSHNDYGSTWEETLPRVHVILEMTHAYLKKLKEIQISKNLYSFDDIMSFAIQLFEEHVDIRNQYKYQMNEILIDEYQDTNDLQDYFVSLISNNNLFMVGDVKQSIYRFRDANPKNFMRLLEQYQKEEDGYAIRLLENFRSNRFLLEKVNELFMNIMTKESGGVNYHDNHQLVSGYQDDFGLNLKNDPIHFHFYDPEQIRINHEDMSKDDIEAHIIAKDIQRKMKQRQTIFSGNNHRPLEYSDITILVDRKNSFEKYAKVLSSYSIPVDIYDRIVFTESEEIIFIHQFLLVIDSLKNNSLQGFNQALYSIGRSFVYQIPDQDIIRFFVQTKADHQAFYTEAIFKSIINDMSLILPKIDQLPNVEIIDYIYELTNIYAKIAYLDKPRTRAKKLDFFRSLIESQKEKDFSDLIQYLQFIHEHDDLDIEFKESKEDIQAIKLMSIHQSKGLQFPIVYMIGLNKKFNFQENKEVFNFSPDYGVLTYGNQEGIYRHFLERLYFRKIKNEDISEKIRLLYVALTRAKEEITLVLEAKDNVNLSKVGYNNYLEMLYDGYQLVPNDLIIDIELPQLEKQDDSVQDTFNIEYKKFDFKEETINEERYSKSENDFYSDDILQALHYGEEIHEMLENIDFYDLNKSVESLPEDIKDSLLYLNQTDLFKSLKSPKFYHEYQFIDDIDGVQRTGIIDLLIIDKDKMIILDYKLKNIDDEAYLLQLTGYYNYLQKVTDLKIEGYLYSLLQKELRKMI